MYSRPSVVPTNAGNSPLRLATVPLAAMCCLGLILFLIASMVVLALIPVYLKTRNISPAGLGQSYYSIANFDGSLGDDGELDTTARSTIASAMDKQFGFPDGSVSVDSATVATTSTKRKRRRYSLTRVRRGQTGSGVQRIYIVFRLNRGRCGACSLRTTSINISVRIVYNGVTFSLSISMTVTSSAIDIPPTLSPTTTAEEVSTTSTTTVVTSNALG